LRQYCCRDLGIAGDVHKHFAEMDTDTNGKIDLEEFKAALATPSPVEAWAKRVPWWQTVADLIPRPTAVGQDGLRTVTGLSDEEVDTVCKVAADEVMIELREQIRVLGNAFERMDQAIEERESGEASVKFQTFKANAGTIDDFHAGLGGRSIMIIHLYLENYRMMPDDEQE
jgi:hypothetical protein